MTLTAQAGGERPAIRSVLPLTALSALGIVFGDMGTAHSIPSIRAEAAPGRRRGDWRAPLAFLLGLASGRVRIRVSMSGDRAPLPNCSSTAPILYCTLSGLSNDANRGKDRWKRDGTWFNQL